MVDDANDLKRFVAAQEGVFERALSELEDGRKTSHWMWFIFPQLRGLGVSPAAQFYGLALLAEAEAYLADPVLGARLKRCTKAVLAISGRTLPQIFGSPDDMKFRSSMTLFDQAADGGAPIFGQAIKRLCGGRADPRTIELARRS